MGLPSLGQLFLGAEDGVCVSCLPPGLTPNGPLHFLALASVSVKRTQVENFLGLFTFCRDGRLKSCSDFYIEPVLSRGALPGLLNGGWGIGSCGWAARGACVCGV